MSGVEAEKVSVSVGQRVSSCFPKSTCLNSVTNRHSQAINERIKELDISDCKVRVSNVDSQESFKNIVVQVIGEMSNKAAPHRKFVQTFVLAEQPNGYFVLNDIFRYIVEDEEEEQLEPEEAPMHDPPPTVAPEPEPEPETLTNSTDPAQKQHDVEQVDKKLEEEIKESTQDEGEQPPELPISAESAENSTAEIIHAEDAPVAVAKEQDSEEPQEVVKVEDLPQEKPKDPDPTPIASPPKPAKATPAQSQPVAAPPKPAAPKTWANLVAANRIAPPAVPSSSSSTSPAPSQPKATQPQVARTASPPASTSEDVPSRPQANGNTGWQTAGQDSSKRQNRQQSVSGNADKDHVLGYVKNVTDKVDASLLKAALAEHGKLVYFDVSRPKVRPALQLFVGFTVNGLINLELCVRGICRRCRLSECCRGKPLQHRWGADLGRGATTAPQCLWRWLQQPRWHTRRAWWH